MKKGFPRRLREASRKSCCPHVQPCVSSLLLLQGSLRQSEGPRGFEIAMGFAWVGKSPDKVRPCMGWAPWSLLAIADGPSFLLISPQCPLPCEQVACTFPHSADGESCAILSPHGSMSFFFFFFFYKDHLLPAPAQMIQLEPTHSILSRLQMVSGTRVSQTQLKHVLLTQAIAQGPGIGDHLLTGQVFPATSPPRKGISP